MPVRSSTRPVRLIIAILFAATVQVLAGCAAWQTRNWDLSQLRDPRAIDLEDRLQQQPREAAAVLASLPVESDQHGAPSPGADTF